MRHVSVLLMAAAALVCGLTGQPARAASTSQYPPDDYKRTDPPLRLQADAACDLVCPPGAVAESEPCGSDYNGGCNMASAVFEPIAIGQSVCGTAWADGGNRDTDWYEITLTVETELIFTVTAEFPLQIGFLDNSGIGDCSASSGYFSVYAHAAPCVETSVSQVCPPGTYWLWVGDQDYYDNPCGSGLNDYVATLKTPYCLAGGGCDEYISRVQVGAIDNSSGCDGYADYSSLSTEMTAGGTYPITVTNGQTVYPSDQCGIWVDWNQNNEFDDAGESIPVIGTPGIGPYTADITVPDGAIEGSCRMRVRIMYTGTLSPCGASTYGEVEDYTIVVSPYCAARGGCDEHISRVQAGDIDNSSGCDRYADYTALSTEIMVGQTVAVTVTNGNPYLGDQCGIWVDWNQDGVFDGLSEAIPVSGTPDAGPYTAVMVPPLNAAVGPTRMRVRIMYSGALSPCGLTNYGEVEDYTIDVKPEHFIAKWPQLPLYNPESVNPHCFMGWHELSIFGGSQLVADDWLSLDGAPITDLHWWGSYLGWSGTEPPAARPDYLAVSLWTNVPAAGGIPSHPGTVLMSWWLTPAQLQERYAGCLYHPDYGFVSSFRYDFHLDPFEYFYPDQEPAVYWLSIGAGYYNVTEYTWGWQTRPYFFNGEAMRIFDPTYLYVGDPFVSGSPIHDLAGTAWDMAFIVTTEGNGDLNRDGFVNLSDLAIFAGQWLTERP